MNLDRSEFVQQVCGILVPFREGTRAAGQCNEAAPMNMWSVKPRGLYWSVTRAGDSSWNAPTFGEQSLAIQFAMECARSNAPASVQIFDANGNRVEQLDFPRGGTVTFPAPRVPPASPTSG